MDNTEVLAAQVFKKDGFGKIRTIVDGGTALFVTVGNFPTYRNGDTIGDQRLSG